MDIERPWTQDDLMAAAFGDPVMLEGGLGDRVRALVKLDTNVDTYLLVGRTG